ncbi:DUF2813 domain-containing protein [Succinivibrio dextrinosolvens]|jgi:putative ATP-dependent endonuclease of OLD family|uniref:DUF2813 domain-containing protein n=1 Tax=Succinivibrio dextrinosolvens TaxID=83771 RepID=UPI0019247133|nr:DUF2813 domain-containing protein [Succinivibrio dextrinosolvens]
MYLEKAKVVNFRGIRKLSIHFEDTSTVLIGENHWGKTSLLRALWMVLGQGEKLCQFEQKDLYVPVELKSYDTFPKDNLVERVTRRKAISFEAEAVEQYKKDKLEKAEQYLSDQLRETSSASEFFTDINEFISSYKHKEEEDVFKKTDNHIHIDLYFRESAINGYAEKDPVLKPFWYFDESGAYYIHWQIVAFYNEEKDEFVTIHNLVNKNNECFKKTDNYEEAFYTIIRLNPVFRLRDSRMDSKRLSKSKKGEKISHMASLIFNDNDLSSENVASLLKMFTAYLDKYLGNYNQGDDSEAIRRNPRNIDEIVKSPISLESLSSIRNMLTAPGLTRSKVVLTYIASALFLSQGDREIDKNATPIMIIEDIESRFHPSLLLSFWSLLSSTATQKIVTTNSGDLLSTVPLQSLRRLHRKFYDTTCFQVDPESSSLNNDDLRRIAFHIRMNRPMAFFARTWILVEGETEVWILTQIASILGISLACEGIRIIEFAQCGLKPLMKVATQLGIAFHVLTDGDEAGKKYAEVALNFIPKKRRDRHLTVIPQKDIEHYLYSQGYEKTFRIAAGVSSNSQLRKGLTSDKVIDMAIKRKSKPGLALLLVDAIQKKGVEGVPVVFASLLQAVRALGQGNYI